MSLCGPLNRTWTRVCSYRCIGLPVGALCHETGMQRCWRKPGRWGWPAEGPPYGTGASCPGHSPWMSRTARCGGTMGPEIKKHIKLYYTMQKVLIWFIHSFHCVLALKATEINWKSSQVSFFPPSCRLTIFSFSLTLKRTHSQFFKSVLKQ